MIARIRSIRLAQIYIIVTCILLVTVFSIFETQMMDPGGTTVFSTAFFMRLAVYGLVVASCFIFRKKIEKYIEGSGCIAKNKIVYFAVYLVLLGGILFSCLYAQRLEHIYIGKMVFAAMAVMATLWAICILYIGNKPEMNVLVIGLSLVLLLPFITQMNHGQDEWAHFAEAYNVSLGHFLHVKQNAVIPKALQELMPNISFQTFISQYRVPLDYSAVNPMDPNSTGNSPSGYPALFYLPSALGLFIGRHLHFTLEAEMFVGRVFNCVFYVLMSFVIVKIMPFGKNVFAVALMAPYLSMLASTYSADGMGAVFVLLFAALCFRLAYTDQKIQIPHYFILVLVAGGAVLFKGGAYAFVLFFVFLIPFKKLFKSEKLARAAKICIPILIVLAAAVLFYKYYTMPLGGGDPRGPGHVDQALQFKNVIQHPVFTLYILVKWYHQVLLSPEFFSLVTFRYFFGEGASMLFPLWILWIFVAVTDTHAENLSFKSEFRQKALLAVYVVMSCVLIPIALYLAFTGVGTAGISGVQPRYFFPVLPFLFLLLNNARVKNTIRNYGSKVAFCASLILAMCEAGTIIR